MKDPESLKKGVIWLTLSKLIIIYLPLYNISLYTFFYITNQGTQATIIML